MYIDNGMKAEKNNHRALHPTALHVMTAPKLGENIAHMSLNKLNEKFVSFLIPLGNINHNKVDFEMQTGRATGTRMERTLNWKINVISHTQN